MAGKHPDEASQADQSERFKQAARELGVELDEDKLKEALRRMGKQSGEADRPLRKKDE